MTERGRQMSRSIRSEMSLSSIVAEGGALTNRTYSSPTMRDPSPDLPEIHRIVKMGNFQGLQDFLDRKPEDREDINVVDHKGRTALHHACLCVLNTAEMVLLLLRKGAYVHAITDKNFLTPLHCACVKGSIDAIKLLLKYGANPDAKSADGRNPFSMLAPTPDNKKFLKSFSKPPKEPKFTKKDKELLLACSNGNEVRVLELIDKEVDINVTDDTTQMTPLMCAVRQGHSEIVHLLLLHAADVHKQDVGRNTALHWASAKGHTNIVKMLAFYNASTNIADRDNYYTPMHWAAAKNYRSIVPELIKFHANPNLPDKSGMTPLHLAAKVGNYEVLDELLNFKFVQVDSEDAYGVRPIHLAVRKGNSRAVTLLIKKGNVDLGVQTITLNTPLHDACEDPQPYIAKMLMEDCVPKMDPLIINSKNYEGNTPLHCAAWCIRKKNPSLTQYILKTVGVLLKNGANPNLYNNAGMIPLMLIDFESALRDQSPENLVARMLAEGGTDLSIIQREVLPKAQTEREKEVCRILVDYLQNCQIANSPLPSGWKTLKDGDRTYFIDSKGNRTTTPPNAWIPSDPKKMRYPAIDVTDELPLEQRRPNISLQDASCPICKEIIFRPATTECGHNFCCECLKGVMKRQNVCPICAKKFPKKEIMINKELEVLLVKAFPERYAARIAEEAK